jgi:hypothetical protein
LNQPGDSHTGAQQQLTTDCPDGYCRQKIRAVDIAIGHDKNEWTTLLYDTKNYNDVNQALRFCEVFKLEAKVSVSTEGYRVQIRNDIANQKQIATTLDEEDKPI